MFALRHLVYLGFVVILLAGCKASPPDEVTTPPPGVNRLELSLSSPKQVDGDSFPNSDEVALKVRLLDPSNNPIKSELVKVSSTIGALSSDTVLTDAQGYGTAKISPSDTLGAGAVTATFGTITAKVNFELLAPLPPAPVATPKINLSLLRSGLAINRFNSNEVVQLRALVTDANNVPLANQIVSFNVELGTIDVATGLTDQSGAAQVNVSASNTNLGAAVGSASVTINKVTLVASVNYEIVESVITVPGVNRLELSLSSPKQVDADSFPNSDEVTLKVRLLDPSNNPIKSELVKVSSTIGTLSSDTVLTDTQGYGTAKISPSDTLGAGAVTATFSAVTANLNFELLAPLPPIPVATPKISLSLLRSGLTINRFKSNEVVQLRALVTDANNVPVANQIVKFSAELGVVDVETGLTDQNGAAQVNVSASNATLGAAAALATATINGVNLAASVNYEILNSTISITEQVVKLGYFNSANTFVENQLGVSIAAATNGDINISAGATLGISLAIVDENNQRIMLPTQVSFASNCVESKRATIGTGVATINGVATTTYEDISCGGGQDVIQATVTVNNQTKSLIQTINIAPENIGSIEFVSSSPQSIVLKGTGGQGQQETSTLTFLVKGSLGNPLAQQAVTFSLNTSAGNLTITPATAITNSLGLVTTKVNAGNVPTAVRVTAAVTTASNQVIQTQSDLLSVNTGMADQDSFSLATESFNPEAESYDGTEVMISARLADAFNNPVPDGTTINFTTEGGNIVPSCNTANGACSVKWTSSEPRVPNHRITILATAVGHETFNDTNGSNTFDDADGAGFQNIAESGLGRVLAAANGFFDMSEAWRDDNENYIHDTGEKFIDFDNNQSFGIADGLFNGPQCSGILCGTGSKKSTHVRKALVMVMSGSDARLSLMSGTQQGTLNTTIAHIGNQYVYVTNDTANQVKSDGASLIIAEDSTETFTLTFADFGLPFGQTLPKGTRIQVAAEGGTLSGITSHTVPNSIGSILPGVYNGDKISFIIKNPNTLAATGDSPIAGNVTITVTTPEGNVTAMMFNYTLSGT